MKKRVIFEEDIDTCARMKVRLRHDGLTQGQFFRHLISMYVSESPPMIEIVDNLKSLVTTRGKKKRKKTKTLLAKGQEQSKAFGLSESEKNEIFDLLEKEIGEI